MSEWPEMVVIQRKGDRYILLDGTQATDFTDCSKYVPASELSRVEADRDHLREKVALKMDDADAAVLRAEAQATEERAERAEAKLAVVRAEVEKLAKIPFERPVVDDGHRQCELFHNTAVSILAILDSSSSLSGGGESSGVGGRLVDDPQKVIVDFLDSWRFCPVSEASDPSRSCLEDAASQLLAALIHDPGTTNTSLSGDEDTLEEVAEVGEALETGEPGLRVKALAALRDYDDHGDYEAPIQALRELLRGGTSGDVEERGGPEPFVGWHLIHDAMRTKSVVEVCVGSDPFCHRFGDVVQIADDDFTLAKETFRNRVAWADVRGAWLKGRKPEPCPICAGEPDDSTQQSSTTGNSLSGEPGDQCAPDRPCIECRKRQEAER